MSKRKKKLRTRLGVKVLAGKMTVTEARAKLGRKAAQDRGPGRGQAPAAGKSAGADLLKGYSPLAAQLWTASELAAMAPFAGHSDPAIRALADAKLAERTVV